MRSFDISWEETYGSSNGKHLNKYPYGQLVTYFFRNKKYLQNGENSKILELGCGAGNNLPLFLNEGYDVYGIDGSKSAINIARERLKNYNNLNLDVMDFTNLKYEDNFFDMVIDRESIYANTPINIEKIYKEINRVLVSGGVFISMMYNINDYHFKKIILNDSYAKYIDINTYTNFKGGTFKGTGIVHFFTKDEVFKLCEENNFEILSLSENISNEIYPKQMNKVSEYILVAQKR